jgi:hypothetical protein
MYEIYELK